MPAVQTNRAGERRHAEERYSDPRSETIVQRSKCLCVLFLVAHVVLFVYRVTHATPARPAPMSGGFRLAPGRGRGSPACTNYVRKVGDTARPARAPVLDGRGLHARPFP
jgi:hypothetical protein